MDDTATQSTDQDLRPFFYDIAQLPGYTIEEMAGDGEGAQEMYDLFGRELVTKTILMSPKLSVFHESAKPGERVKPHRHGTHQLTYVLRGELIYGNQRTGFALEADIDRTAFGISWNMALPNGKPALADTVTLSVDLQLVAA